MEKEAYNRKMTFDVPDSEKKIAREASECFEQLVSLIRKASNHLDIIYYPFNKYEALNPKETLKQRAALRRYRDQIRENYIKILAKSRRCTVLMSEFASDNRTVEMMNSFIGEVEDVKKSVNNLMTVFSNIGAHNFRELILKSIEDIKQETEHLIQLINDRILDHIDTNILAKKWIDNIKDEKDKPLYRKPSWLSEIYNERSGR